MVPDAAGLLDAIEEVEIMMLADEPASVEQDLAQGRASSIGSALRALRICGGGERDTPVGSGSVR
jgi:phosphoenolpyruvate synthase/pyruvate phosphate dikinase